MKQEIIKKIKIGSVVSLLILLLIAVALATVAVLIENKLREKDAIIESLTKDNKLKDSLYITCNGELAKINNDPIYQYCIKNDLSDR